uniref:Ferredoxin family protein n=1 Tax=Rhizophora mucronata TaxID=61149 RepID=A0A2P2K4J2_RHIMU
MPRDESSGYVCMDFHFLTRLQYFSKMPGQFMFLMYKTQCKCQSIYMILSLCKFWLCQSTLQLRKLCTHFKKHLTPNKPYIAKYYGLQLFIRDGEDKMKSTGGKRKTPATMLDNSHFQFNVLHCLLITHSQLQCIVIPFNWSSSKVSSKLEPIHLHTSPISIFSRYTRKQKFLHLKLPPNSATFEYFICMKKS